LEFISSLSGNNEILGMAFLGLISGLEVFPLDSSNYNYFFYD
jgi:hypothetical protein